MRGFEIKYVHLLIWFQVMWCDVMWCHSISNYITSYHIISHQIVSILLYCFTLFYIVSYYITSHYYTYFLLFYYKILWVLCLRLFFWIVTSCPYFLWLFSYFLIFVNFISVHFPTCHLASSTILNFYFLLRIFLFRIRPSMLLSKIWRERL